MIERVTIRSSASPLARSLLEVKVSFAIEAGCIPLRLNARKWRSLPPYVPAAG